MSKQTRERLARRAAERGSTPKDVVVELAAATLTVAELAENFGIKVTEAELAASARLREMTDRQDSAE